MMETKSTTRPSDNEAQLLLDTGRRLALEGNRHPHPRGLPYIVLKDATGKEAIHYLDNDGLPWRPVYKQGIVPLHDAHSFCAYFSDHAAPSSRIYASLDPLQFVAVLNEHDAQPGVKDDWPSSGANWRDHRAVYAPKYSAECQEWLAKNTKQFKGNVEFAEWLQDQGPDFIEPSGADILEIALNFSVHDNVAFSNPTRLQDGNTELNWKRIVEGASATSAGKVRIPELLKIAIPVWGGLEQEKYTFEARLRYRLRDSGLVIWYQLIRPHKVIEQAFADLVASINAATSTPMLFGSPE